MAAILTGLTLYREKSTVRRFDVADEGDSIVFQVRSNRISLSLKSGPIDETVVVRGQNIPSTLRVASLVIEQFNRNPTLFSDETTTHLEWAEMWKPRVSSYEKQFASESWVSVHYEGGTVFTTNPSPQIDEMERMAMGGEINEDVIRAVCTNFHGSMEDIVVHHDSQTAVVFSPFKEYHRAAILERRSGKTGSFAVSAFHPPKPGKPVRYSGFINFCADIVEALTLKVFLERIRVMVEENKVYGSAITPAQVAGAMGRKRDLMQFVQSYERANRISYRPDRPEFF